MHCCNWTFFHPTNYSRLQVKHRYCHFSLKLWIQAWLHSRRCLSLIRKTILFDEIPIFLHNRHYSFLDSQKCQHQIKLDKNAHNIPEKEERKEIVELNKLNNWTILSKFFDCLRGWIFKNFTTWTLIMKLKYGTCTLKMYIVIKQIC